MIEGPSFGGSLGLFHVNLVFGVLGSLTVLGEPLGDLWVGIRGVQQTESSPRARLEDSPVHGSGTTFYNRN